MRYVHLFQTADEFNSAYTGESYIEPWFSYTREDKGIAFNKPTDPTTFPLTFDIISDGAIGYGMMFGDEGDGKTIEYKVNDGEWTSFTPQSSDEWLEIDVHAGDSVSFRGDNDAYGDEGNFYVFASTDGAAFNLKGNIMSLVDSVNFRHETSLAEPYAFANLFQLCSGLESAENLALPATTLSQHCYEGMFSYTSINASPELPATTLAAYCYQNMFSDCTELLEAPELPATTLDEGCYSNMFVGCTSLTGAPELPATTLANACYASMFNGCTSLTTAPELPATTLANGCYSTMFASCTGLTTTPSSIGTSATTMGEAACMSMFSNCTSLTTAPALPAETLASYCYDGMFYGCENLNFIKCLATDINAKNCTWNWVYGVGSTGTFVGVDGNPAGWVLCDPENDVNYGVPRGWSCNFEPDTPQIEPEGS